MFDLSHNSSNIPSDVTNLKLELINAKSKLYNTLNEHQNFYPRQREMLELVNEFEYLKHEGENLYQNLREDVIPKLTSMHSKMLDESDNRTLSASVLHKEAVSNLREYLDMHANCVYLIELHQSLGVLESAINQLCLCAKVDVSTLPESTDDFEWDDHFDHSTEDVRKDCNNKPYLENSKEDIDEETYRLCTDAVVNALEESEYLFTQNANFNKDTLVLFQNFRHTVVRCKCRLASHVDELWRRWICITVNKPNLCKMESKENDIFGFLSGLSLPSSHSLLNDVMKMMNKQSIKSDAVVFDDTCQMEWLMNGDDGGIGEEDEEGTAGGGGGDECGLVVVSRLQIFAKPQLIRQLLRIMDALNESKSRIYEFSHKLWTHLFRPWFEPCLTTATNNDSSCKWLKFKTTLIHQEMRLSDADSSPKSSTNSAPLPSWCLDLVQSNVSQPEDNYDLISDSCLQLITVFEQLSTYLFGLEIAKDADGHVKRFIDLALNRKSSHHPTVSVSDLFDSQLGTLLIDGRLTMGLPQAENPIGTELLLALTQNVCHLIGVGKETGFLTGDFNEDNQPPPTIPTLAEQTSSSLAPPLACSIQSDVCLVGGASRLWTWLNNLSSMGCKQVTNQILADVRSLLSDRSLFYNPIRLVDELKAVDDEQTNQIACESDHHSMQADDNDDGEDGEVGLELFDKRNEYEYLKTMPSLRLLNSKINMKDLCRYLDLGSFKFPQCTISSTIPMFMDKLNNFLSQRKAYLDQLEERLAERRSDLEDPNGMTTDNNDIMSHVTNGIDLVRSLIEFVPRLFLIYTTLMPMLYADLFQTDLKFAVLFHNNCMYLAHQCLTLGEQAIFPLAEQIGRLKNTISKSDNSTLLIERSASMSTCILVPHLRQTAIQCLLENLHSECQKSLVDGLKQIKSFQNIKMNVVQTCCDHLNRISNDLILLPQVMYLRCMGIMCNTVCTELISHLLDLVDLTKSDCDVALIALEKITKTIEEIFAQQQVNFDLLHKSKSFSLLDRRVPSFARLQGIILILRASSMIEIRDVLWANGHGPLITKFTLTTSEIRGLIKALYSSSHVRDQLLQKLH